jgi:hypothetical protein
LGLGVALAWALVLPSTRRRLREIVRATPLTWAIAALVGAVSVYPMASHYLEAGREVGLRSFQETLPMVPRPYSWLHFGRASWFYGWAASHEPFRSLPMEQEHRIGFGILTTVVAAVGLWQARHRSAVCVIGLTGIALVAMSTMYGDVVLWRWVHEWVPGAKAIRAVARIGLVVLFPISVGVAVAVSGLARTGRPALAALLGALCLLEQGETTPAFDKIRSREEVAAIAAHVGADCTAFVFTPVGGRRPPFMYQLDAMWAQLETGVPTLNGFSGDAPPGWMLGGSALYASSDDRRFTQAIQGWARSRNVDPDRICRVKLDVD